MRTIIGKFVATFAVLSAVGIEAAQSGASVAATRDLISALNEAGLDSIATIDPTEPGAFVAALHIKGGQLLVVRARHPSVDALSARLAARQFRDVYIDLQATPTPQGKLFVMDSGADGLPGDSDQPSEVDVVYQDGTRQFMLNGARAQKLSSNDYRERLQDAEANYTRLLNVLLTALGRHSSAETSIDPMNTAPKRSLMVSVTAVVAALGLAAALRRIETTHIVSIRSGIGLEYDVTRLA